MRRLLLLALACAALTGCETKQTIDQMTVKRLFLEQGDTRYEVKVAKDSGRMDVLQVRAVGAVE